MRVGTTLLAEVNTKSVDRHLTLLLELSGCLQKFFSTLASHAGELRKFVIFLIRFFITRMKQPDYLGGLTREIYLVTSWWNELAWFLHLDILLVDLDIWECLLVPQLWFKEAADSLSYHFILQGIVVNWIIIDCRFISLEFHLVSQLRPLKLKLALDLGLCFLPFILLS